MSYFSHRTAAEINLFLYVGTGFIREVIVETVDTLGESYNEYFVDEIQNEVLLYDTVLEDLLMQEGWADIAVVEFDGGYDVHGTIDYEDVETPLDTNETAELERIIEDWIIPQVEEAVGNAGVEELVWIPVESSNIQEFAFDVANRFLYVRFLPSGRGSFSEGSLYVYHGVEAEIYQLFLQAPSAGQFVWSHLRDRYDYDRLE